MITAVAMGPPPICCEDRTALPLSFAQARLWFLNQLEGDSQATSYNISAALQVAGRLDEAALRTALTALTERHESLRMNVRNEAGEPRVTVRAAFDPLQVEDLIWPAARAEALRTEAEAHARYAFDLEGEPLLRLKLLQLDSGEQVLLLNMHHIVADGWSLGVLVRDLGELYAAALEGRASSLASPTLHYADYAAGNAVARWVLAGATRLARAAGGCTGVRVTDRPTASGGEDYRVRSSA